LSDPNFGTACFGIFTFFGFFIFIIATSKIEPDNAANR
jgi:hypothetical protein